MTRAPILFRVDASRAHGWENLCRCLVYAAALQRRRRPAHFLSQLEPLTLAPSVKKGGNEWIAAAGPAGTEADLAQTIQQIRRIRPEAVVVDSPNVQEEYLRELRGTGVAVLSMDSLGTTAFPSQLVINPLLGPTREGYTHDRRTQLLLGARYAIVRPEIRRVRPLRSQEPIQPFRVLVALGDDDLNNQAGELAKILLNTPRVGRVDILTRAFNPALESLKALAAECPDRLEVVYEANEVPLRLTRGHLALTAGNNWSLELACVGIPQLVVVQSETHWPTAQRLEEEGAATCLGWHENVSAGTIRAAVSSILGEPQERQLMSRAGRKLIDGRGPDRLVTALEIVLRRMQGVMAPAMAA